VLHWPLLLHQLLLRWMLSRWLLLLWPQPLLRLLLALKLLAAAVLTWLWVLCRSSHCNHRVTTPGLLGSFWNVLEPLQERGCVGGSWCWCWCCWCCP
jgi:hypothetical protein